MQDMAVPWTGIASVETLVQTLARTIASAAAANVHPCIGQLSSIDIGSIAARLLNALLLVLGEPSSHYVRSQVWKLIVNFFVMITIRAPVA